MPTSDLKRILVLINPNSGLGHSFRVLLDTFQEVWDSEEQIVWYQLSKSKEDSERKVAHAIQLGIDLIIVVGGDGMINSIGRLLMDTGVTMGVIPTGSGNGFARHFGIPLNPEKAIHSLAGGEVMDIDVGTANGRPFFVTCSLAWDAAIVKSFEKSPVRGILPYIFAATYELFEYNPEVFNIQLDAQPATRVQQPMLFTIANLTQYGGGALIAPQATADDGYLWLTYALKADVPKLIPQLPKLFEGKINEVQNITSKKFKTLKVIRESAQPIQVDGELMPTDRDVEISIKPRALKVLVPKGKATL
ncbi:diacylglycerol kinase family lipid kinase [Kiritimatiellaeota bacterium B1221]|nr:diacylglycerol kinase family lipid kinase [Kiritimatiellaeota bacterium B1221]